jgi:TolA-binding protein
MRQWGIASLIFIFSFVGCQSFHKKSQLPHGSAQTKAKSKEKSKIAKAARPVAFSESPSSIFKEHNELTRTIAQESTQLQGPIQLSDKEKVFFELAGEKIDGLSEIQVYRKAVEKYQQSDEAALTAYANLLLKKFPRSIYCDNALYLQGMLAFSEKNFGESLSSFQKILANYPKSNKAVSALYAKGVVFKKMNLDKQAVRILAEVVNKYPGSPESARAQVELKLITR